MVRLALRNNDLGSPWTAFSDWTREFDQIFDDMNRALAPTRMLQGNMSDLAPCDIHESENGFYLSMDLPGVSKDNINVESNNGLLTVTAERKHEASTQDSKAHRVERRIGKIQRSFRIPDGVNGEQIQASFDNGVLHLTLPKSDLAKPKKIEIGTGKSGFIRNLLGNKEDSKQDVAINS
ncbi:Hsp20/alpha crystallin family protein [Pseudobacteriovorax antillogorgiicola]|uniref:HSP20 family protein n=1 Tax=Pseudobacteriovorax antillogorgiicola TaxID=1513793 RepID=A0A1Y6CKH6_9BACT|nr:Hsp20/alpha crystallin family protein [Pseudobacteriovorax antillogorgiicola]TCS48282.1 heat shock protein Hsp20 [Pseudobacteriovorax antillogorgiicola]SMF56978.1 HSP20 family protein [Pseudobacteriovorax antillogorgiicola]